MQKLTDYGRLKFDPGFLFARDETGAEIRFTRSERALLVELTGHAGVVIDRARLLNAIAGIDADVSDRNIDFLINRLRRKLGDSSRRPVYIATQYGEGYWWIAKPGAPPRPQTAAAFLVVGPIRGLPSEGDGVEHGRRFAEDLRRRLDRHTPAANPVVMDADCPRPEAFAKERPQFAAELDFVRTAAGLDCAITVKEFASGRIAHASRHTVPTASHLPHVQDLAETTAAVIVEAIWSNRAFRGNAAPAPDEVPMALRLNAAAKLIADNASGWIDAGGKLRARLAREPENYEAMLLLATNIHTHYILSGPPIFLLPDRRAEDEAEMERLVLASLPAVQGNPILALAAAKLLYVLGRGHEGLALEMAESAFASTTAFATSFSVLAQLSMYEGRLGDAAGLYGEGLKLSEPGSDFHAYLLTMKASCHAAGGDRDLVEAELDALDGVVPGAKRGLVQLFAPPPPAALPAEAHTADVATAIAIARYCHYINGRHFKREAHRVNLMAGPLRLITERYGTEAVPADIRASMPSLFG